MTPPQKRLTKKLSRQPIDRFCFDGILLNGIVYILSRVQALQRRCVGTDYATSQRGLF